MRLAFPAVVALSVFAAAARGSVVLVAGGAFLSADGAPALGVAQWDGSAWSALGPGLSGGEVNALRSFQGLLVAGGDFTRTGDNTLSLLHIAQWNGTAWRAFASGADSTVFSLEVMDGALFFGGTFRNIGGISASYVARWDGASWSALGAGPPLLPTVYAMTVYGGRLVVGGRGMAGDGEIVRWNGDEGWESIGTSNGPIYALNGYGPYGSLVAGGNIRRIDQLSDAAHVVSFDGSRWTSLSSGLDGFVYALTSESSLLAGGAFDRPNSPNHVAVYAGSGRWYDFGDNDGVDDTVLAFAWFEGQPCIGGRFTTANSESVKRVARYNGVYWAALGSGMDFDVNALATYDAPDPTAPPTPPIPTETDGPTLAPQAPALSTVLVILISVICTLVVVAVLGSVVVIYKRRLGHAAEQSPLLASS